MGIHGVEMKKKVRWKLILGSCRSIRKPVREHLFNNSNFGNRSFDQLSQILAPFNAALGFRIHPKP